MSVTFEHINILNRSSVASKYQPWKTRAHILLPYIHHAPCLRASLQATVVSHKHVLYLCYPLIKLPVVVMWCGHALLTFCQHSWCQSIIFSQSQKKTVLVSSCDWVVVEVSVVPFYWQSPPCSVAVLLAFGLGGAQRVNAPPQKRQVLLASQPRSCWASLPRRRNEPPGWNSGHDDITCTFVWRCKDDLTRLPHSCVFTI